VFAEGDVLDMRITEVDAANHRIVCEVVRVPKFEGGEPQFIQLATPRAADEGEATDTSVNDQVTDAVEGEAPVAEAPAAAPAADAADTESTASAEEAPASEAAPAEEAPSSDEGAEQA
jgi:hypothetical protein